MRRRGRDRRLRVERCSQLGATPVAVGRRPNPQDPSVSLGHSPGRSRARVRSPRATAVWRAPRQNRSNGPGASAGTRRPRRAASPAGRPRPRPATRHEGSGFQARATDRRAQGEDRIPASFDAGVCAGHSQQIVDQGGHPLDGQAGSRVVEEVPYPFRARLEESETCISSVGTGGGRLIQGQNTADPLEVVVRCAGHRQR